MRILLAMSGGVDSSMAAHFLTEQGYEIVGITFITYEEGDVETQNLSYINDAKIVAQKFNFKHYTVDIQESFKETIVSHFVSEYMQGRTPNPCVVCNPTIKWKTLMDYADEFDCEYVATGHYAVKNQEKGRYFITEATDGWKDQSYFLWKLPQEYLKRTMFPLGKFVKTEIKQLAAELGFTSLSAKKESYDVCFTKGQDYRTFLKNYDPEIDKKIGEGNFVDTEGKILGQHKGYAFYTVGQRKGLGIATGYPAYVLDIDAKTNTITLGKQEDLAEHKLVVSDFNLQKYAEIPRDKKFLTKIRYKDKGRLGKLEVKDDKLLVTFDEPVYGVAPGQSAVFYEGDDLVGGGIIEKS